MNNNYSARQRIIAAAETHTRVPLAELQNITNVDVSNRQFVVVFMKHIYGNGAVKRPLLQETHAATRLKWAREHQFKTREDWAKIAWSDEAAIQKDSARQQVWVSDVKQRKKNMHGRKTCSEECSR